MEIFPLDFSLIAHYIEHSLSILVSSALMSLAFLLHPNRLIYFFSSIIVSGDQQVTIPIHIFSGEGSAQLIPKGLNTINKWKHFTK